MELNRDPNLLKEISKEVINLRDECYYLDADKPKSELVKLSNAADFFKKKGIECDQKRMDLLVDGLKVRQPLNKLPNKRPKMN